MSWTNKFNVFKGAVDKDKAARKTIKPGVVCIHGEDNCVRCAQEDFEVAPTSQWTVLEESDLRRIVKSLPESVRLSMRMYPNQAVLAGGYIRASIAGETIHDVDVFIPNRTALGSLSLPGTIVEKDKTITYMDSGVEVQIIWRYDFKEPVQVPDEFDYTIAKAAIWYDGTQFVSACHVRFYRDLARKMLVYSSERNNENIRSLPRLMKYAAYGYSIDPKSLAQVMTRTCLSLDLSNGLDGLTKQFEDIYLGDGTEDEWTNMSKPYVKPPTKRTYDYSGS